MSNSSKDFQKLEEECAQNFKRYFEDTSVKQVIYLSGITNEDKLSKHLLSRKNVENALPVMIAPKWLNTRTQPLAVRDVLAFLHNSAGKQELYNTSFDIYGPEILTYKEMLLQFAEVRKLNRYIYTVPVMTPRLSSYWLYFVTSTSYKLAATLVGSMGVEIVGKSSDINKVLDVTPITYKESVELAFEKIEQNSIISSWKDSFISSGRLKNSFHKYVNVPKFGCFKDYKERKVVNTETTIEKIWSIGGETGWYYGTFLWRIRGYIDKLFGGIGLRRGRTSPTEIDAGDALDFWRVIYADKTQKKLLLYAEMKLPGEAWLEFKIEDNYLKQTATFRPKGLAGRLYWYSVLPFHGLIFKGMINKLTSV